MVYEQGLTVDSIESSVEQTSVFVSQGAENLRKASSYKVSKISYVIKNLKINILFIFFYIFF